MCAELSPPATADRRAIALDLCGLLASSAADPDVSLAQLGLAAREIAAMLLDLEAADGSRREVSLRVIEGGRR